ncbi:MAG: hypothetical protein AAFX76_04785 [Planctomycetota bacterium]
MEWLKKMFAVAAMLSVMTFGVGLTAGCEEGSEPADAIEGVAAEAEEAAEDAADEAEDAANDAADALKEATE